MLSASLLIEVPFFGIPALWILAAVPAAVVTLMKDRWALFAVGFATFGLTWMVGAAGIAPPSSPWARRFYGPERMARAEDPVRHRRPLAALARGVAWVVGAILVLGLLAARPAPLLGVDGKSLQGSVGGGFLEMADSCDRLEDGAWRCYRWDGEASGDAPYRVEMRSFGCWDAVEMGAVHGNEVRERRSGCVTIVDYVMGARWI